MKRPRGNLLSLAPALCQRGLGSALMKSHVCRRETLKSWTDLAQNKKPDRELGQKQLGAGHQSFGNAHMGSAGAALSAEYL